MRSLTAGPAVVVPGLTPICAGPVSKAAYSGGVADIGATVRASGRRLTAQRSRVLSAIAELGHATPEEIVASLAASEEGAMAASTVYRNLDALQEIGLVDHTHVDHRVPSYHLAEHADHIHLVCRRCGRVQDVPAELGDIFAQAVRSKLGFVVEMTHAAVHGRCADCAQMAEESRERDS